MSRGVLYMVWGEEVDVALRRSIASLKAMHPELPHHVVRLSPGTDLLRGLLEKSRMMDLSPYEETLFLDADTVVLDRLDFGFEQAARRDVACSICECPWTRRYRGMPRDDGVEYNTGVLFFTPRARPLFNRWNELAPRVDSSINFLRDGRPANMPFNDQASFAKAIAESDRLPFVLPVNWNFRPAWHTSFFGPLKVWHGYEDPPAGLAELNAYYRGSDAIIQYHSLQRS